MMKKKIPISKILLTILVWLIGFTMLLPLIWMISTASKVEADVFNFPIEWIPKRWNFINNMKAVWGGTYHFGMYYLNSAKITLLATFLQVLVSALGAYGFSKVHFRGRDTIFLLYLATMMIPSQVTVVSQFIIMRQIGLYNTHRGIIIMMAFSVYGVFFKLILANCNAVAFICRRTHETIRLSQRLRQNIIGTTGGRIVRNNGLSVVTRIAYR